MLQMKFLPVEGFEKVLEIKNPSLGLHGFIAIHSTSMGPALGGIRIYPYTNSSAALTDALRLAKGMTYKSALVELGLGGGKGVIIADPKKDKTNDLLMSFGEAIDSLKGLYIGAEDMGTSVEDMLIIRKSTSYVAALPSSYSSGDPARFTAFGVYKGIQAACQSLWGDSSVRGKVIAIQGAGNVGAKLLEHLFWNGAKLIISDTDEQRIKNFAHLYGASIVSAKEILQTPCDILSPCAIGGILNSETISQLKCKAVAGGANNQLLSDEDGIALMKREILYAPDFIINAGGLINASAEFNNGGYNPEHVRDKVNNIYDTLLTVFKLSKEQGKPPGQVANELAEYKILHAIGKRSKPIVFT